jgi:hypothetical protein
MPLRLQHCQTALFEFGQLTRLAELSRLIGVPVADLGRWPGRKVEEFLTIAEAIKKHTKGDSDGR